MITATIETGVPLSTTRVDRASPQWIEDLKALPYATGAEDDKSLLIHLKVRQSISGQLYYWAKKLGCKFRTQMTNKGLRVWKIKPSN